MLVDGGPAPGRAVARWPLRRWPLAPPVVGCWSTPVMLARAGGRRRAAAVVRRRRSSRRRRWCRRRRSSPPPPPVPPPPVEALPARSREITLLVVVIGCRAVLAARRSMLAAPTMAVPQSWSLPASPAAVGAPAERMPDAAEPGTPAAGEAPRLRRSGPRRPLADLDDDVAELLGVGEPAQGVDRQLEGWPAEAGGWPIWPAAPRGSGCGSRWPRRWRSCCAPPASAGRARRGCCSRAGPGS